MVTLQPEPLYIYVSRHTVRKDLFGECATSFAFRGICYINMPTDQYVSDDGQDSLNFRLPALSHTLTRLAE